MNNSTGDTLPQRFAARMGHLLGPNFPDKLALAVSGGGDSMAMLALTHEWARVYGVALHVVTVDHGLRSESGAEASMVADECAALGHSHTTLKWTWDGQGNLQDAARRARISLIDDWRGDISHVLMAHTQDDQAETLLMRLARGSGVEGLSAMAEVRDLGEWQIVRPLLSEPRAALRHHVTVLKVPFVDDPSNENVTYDRVRIRKAIAALELDTTTLSSTAARMARAQKALVARAADVARSCVSEPGFGDLLFDRDAFGLIERDTQLRLLAAALQWVSCARYRPRSNALESLLDRALGGAGGTLHGVEIRVSKTAFHILREASALQGKCQKVDGQTLWDGRWLVHGQDLEAYEIRALGADGWAQLPKDRGLNYSLAQTLPALFSGPAVAGFAPLNFGVDHNLVFQPPGGTFTASLLSR